jgi:hypothetical protein
MSWPFQCPFLCFLRDNCPFSIQILLFAAYVQPFPIIFTSVSITFPSISTVVALKLYRWLRKPHWRKIIILPTIVAGVISSHLYLA